MIGLAGILDTSWGEVRTAADGTQSTHWAIDFNKPKTNISGLEIHSVSNGTVTYISPDASTNGGNYIIITANDGTVWTYCHLQTKSPLVVNANVIAGSTIIGQVGNTGTLSTGAHLHLQCKQNGNLIDPRLKIGSSDC